MLERKVETVVRRSRRKTVSIQIRDDQVLVRAPYFVSDGELRGFLEKHRRWIEKRLAEEASKREAASDPFTEEELKALTERARQVFSERVAYYAPRVGVSYGRISIRHQRTRWGSCSAAGNLNFNCLLLLAPPEVLDSVVVHELCHRKEMNHSDRFYSEVLRVFPEYRKWHKWLKEHGNVLTARLPV